MSAIATSGRVIGYTQAINEALVQEMERDPNVFVMGEDIGRFGGMFRATEGLLTRFGEKRVIDTPISESGFIGMALGAAMAGKRPVVELMFLDFALVAMDQIVNQVAKTQYMTGGKASVPLTIRTQGGGYKGTAAQHSQMIDALFVHVPGLKIVTPATPADAKGLLAAAVRDPNPVLVIEHKQLYGVRGEVPEGEHVVPLGSAAIVRPGTSLTICSYSFTLSMALAAAETLASERIEAEVVDLRTLNPLDWAAVEASVRKTHRVLIAHEGHARCGVGADLAAQIQEKLFDELDGPVLRVCGADVPVPFAQSLEDAALPSAAKIVEMARRLVAG